MVRTGVHGYLRLCSLEALSLSEFSLQRLEATWPPYYCSANGRRRCRAPLSHVPADPDSLCDEAQIKKLEPAAENARDPIDRLRALAELERARSVDGSTFPRRLRAAGQGLGGQRRDPRVGLPGRRAAGRRPATGAGTRQSAKAVPLDAIKDHVLSRSGPFTLAEVMEAAGRSPATVRKAVEELVGAGRVTKLGPAADHQGRTGHDALDNTDTHSDQGARSTTYRSASCWSSSRRSSAGSSTRSDRRCT